jgi:hypothetical protein
MKENAQQPIKEAKPQTEMEAILQRTVDRLSMQVAELTLNLNLAHSQIEIMKEQQEQKNAKK